MKKFNLGRRCAFHSYQDQKVKPSRRKAFMRFAAALAVGQSLLFGADAYAQTISTKFNGVANPIRIEFWDETDGEFTWGGATDNRRSTQNWTGEEMAAVERGMQYWMDVLGTNNNPGRTINVRILRAGQELIGTNWDSMGSNSNTPAVTDGGVDFSIVQHVWAEGQTTASSRVADTLINFSSANNLTAINGPLQLSSGYSMERVMLHEFAHSLGQRAANDGTWGNGGRLSQFEEMVVYRDNNNLIQSIVSGQAYSNNETDPNFPYYFNGANAVSVFGDLVPINRKTRQASHLWIDPFNMTHLEYRNYPFFSEVELAVIQDLGYDIDRSNFFGKSYYRNGTNEVNNNGFNSSSTYGVGLHVKGNVMTIRQAADLTASGIAGNGIRIDGVNNTVTIDEGVAISTTGEMGVGLLVSNGFGNVVIHRGEIEAGDIGSGITGTGILIDFGFNSVAGGDNRTSATRVDYLLNETEQNGYLVDRLDLSGSIDANQGTAIEISNRAAVREINIMQGANISGSIISNALKSGTFENYIESGSFENPILNFGLTANNHGARKNTADVNFNFNYDGVIGGLTPMDANFLGGVNHASGTQLDGIALFENVVVGEQGRLTQIGQLGSLSFINSGELSVINGGGVTSGVFVNDGNSLLNNGDILATSAFSNMGTVTSEVGSTATLDKGNIHLAATSQFINNESTLQANYGSINVFGVLAGRDGAVNASDFVTVFDGGRLQGTPTITAMVVDNRSGGTMAAGNSIGTMTIDATYMTNGNVEYEITSQALPQDSDLIRLINNSTAYINNLTSYPDRGAFHFDAEVGNYDIARRYTILETDAAGNLFVFQRPVTTDNLAEQRVILRTDKDLDQLYTANAQDYYAYIGRDVPYVEIAESKNQKQIAGILDVLKNVDDGTPLGNEIQWIRDTLDLIVSENDVRTAFDQMSGNIYSNVGSVTVQQSHLNYSRMAAGMRSNSNLCGPAMGPVSNDGLYGTVTGFGSAGDVDAGRNAGPVSWGVGGTQVIIGMGRDEYQAGAFYNYTGGTIRGGGKAGLEMNEFGLFLLRQGEMTHFLLAGSGGVAEYDINRTVHFGNTDIQNPIYQRHQTSTNVGTASVYGEFGADFEFDVLAIRPFAGLGYSHLGEGDYREKGGSLALDGKMNSIDSLRSTLGTDVSFCIDPSKRTVMDLRGAWMHEFQKNHVGSSTASFANLGGSKFNTLGSDLGSDYVQLGANLSRESRGGGARVFGGYDLTFNNRHAVNTGNVGVEFKW